MEQNDAGYIVDTHSCFRLYCPKTVLLLFLRSLCHASIISLY